MARPRVDTVSNEPVEWKAGQRAARERRRVVGEQLAEAVVRQDKTGSIDLVRRRAGELRAAEESGDPLLRRGAAWDLALACAAYAVALDLGHGRPRRSRVAT